MDNEKTDLNPDQSKEEMDWEAFFAGDDAQEWEKEKLQKRKRKNLIVKTISSLLVAVLIISGLEVWFNVFNIPAIRFVEVSNRLSQKSEVKEYKQSVVTIEMDGRKGTGFNIKQDGLIVTNAHVVEGLRKVNVHTKTEGSFVGKVISNHPDLDLAIVEIDANNLPVLPLSFEEDWEKWNGEQIIFIGNPLAFTQIANEGTIIGQVELQGWDVPMMMIEAPIYRGNSGSPVINQDGEVIGVIFATLENPTIETKETIGAAIPSSHMKEILEDLNINDLD